MNIMIFVKWGTDWTDRTSTAPSIITLMINFPLKFGSPEGFPLYGDKDGSEQ